MARMNYDPFTARLRAEMANFLNARSRAKEENRKQLYTVRIAACKKTLALYAAELAKHQAEGWDRPLLQQFQYHAKATDYLTQDEQQELHDLTVEVNTGCKGRGASTWPDGLAAIHKPKGGHDPAHTEAAIHWERLMVVMGQRKRELRNSLNGLKNTMRRMKLDDETWRMKLSTQTVTEWEVTKRAQWAGRCNILAQLMAVVDLAEANAQSRRLVGHSPMELGAADGAWWLLLTASQRKKYEGLVQELERATNLLDASTGKTAPFDTVSRRREYNRMKQRQYRQRIKAQDAYMVEQMRLKLAAQAQAQDTARKQAAGGAFDEDVRADDERKKAEVIALKEQTPQDALRVQADIEARIARGESLEGLLRPTPPEPALNPLGLKPSPGINKEAWAALMDAIEEDEE
jgi:hypothetical protein